MTDGRKVQFTRIIFYLAIVALSGCAVFNPANQRPEVHLISIEALPRDGLEQSFLIGLNIINASSNGLRISGMAYSLRLNGRKVASGVAGGLREIRAHSESRIKLEARANLLSGLRVITELLRNPQPVVEYQFEIRLRKAWWPVPLTITEQGTINLDSFDLKAGGLLGNE